LPPVGLAAIRAAAELVQTQSPEATQAKVGTDDAGSKVGVIIDAAPAAVQSVLAPAKAAVPALTHVAPGPAQQDDGALASAQLPRAEAAVAAAADSKAADPVPAAAPAVAAHAEGTSELDDDDFAWESARASVSEVVGPMAAARADTPSSAPDQPAQDGAPLADDRSSPRARQTRAYSPQRAEALRREFETSRALAGATGGASSRPPPSGDSGSILPRPSLRAVPPVPPVVALAQGTLPGSGAPPATSPVVAGTDESRPSAPAGDSMAAPSSPESPKARVSVPRVSHPQGLALLVSRDAEPTTDAPLTYRERSYWVAPSSDHARLEALLQAEYIVLRRELLSHPRGQLIHLAAFDHVFDDQPTRPPLATLEWKDWRGTAVFSVTTEPEEGEERSAVLERPPSQRAPESEWPSPLGSRVRDQVSNKPSPASTWPVPAAHRAPQPRRSVPRTESKVPPRAVPDSQRAAAKPAFDSVWPPVASANGVSSWPAMPMGHDSSLAASTREPTGEVDHRLAAAFEAMPELYFLSTPVAGLEFTIELVTTLVPCEAVSACLYDINTDEFRFVALSGAGAATRRASAVPSQAGLFGAAKRAPSEALVVAKPGDDSRFDAQVDGREGLDVRSLVYLPVRFGGQLLGMLQLINRSKDAGFTPADVSVLTYVATQLAEFLLSRRTL
jgi:hypothetical protein